MKQQSYFRSQIELSKYINNLIDEYWLGQLNENHFLNSIKNIIINNKEKIFNDENEFNSTIKQRCGKRRLELLEKIVLRKV